MSNQPFVRIFPFPVHNSEGDVFVWWASAEMKEHRLLITGLFHNLVRRRLGFINEIGIEDVELRNSRSVLSLYHGAKALRKPCSLARLWGVDYPC